MIFCIIGKSCSGKDTLYQNILNCPELKLTPIISYTTRPMREGEQNGVEYHFVSNTDMKEFETEDKILERRTYHTVNGNWNYFTLKFDLSPKEDYICISTYEGVKSLINYFGQENVGVLYLALDNAERFKRCLAREERQKNPNYEELCRRYLADQKDYAAVNIADILHAYVIDANLTQDLCLSQAKYYIENWRKIDDPSTTL